MSLREATSAAACWIALPIVGSVDIVSSCPILRSTVRHTKSELHVDCCRGALQNAKRLDDGRRHAVLRLVDPEVLQRSLRLCSPVFVRWDLNLPKCIRFCSCFGHVICSYVESSVEARLRWGLKWLMGR